MSDTVRLSELDMVELFLHWNKKSAENNWHENALDAEEQAAYFFKIAKSRIENGKID